MEDRIVVTGMGVISAIGNTVAENRNSLAAGLCGMSRLEMFESKFSQTPFGEIKLSNQTLMDKLDAHEPGIVRTTLLALHALREALDDSQLTPEEISSYDTAFVGATTVGGMCLTNEMYLDSQKDTPGSVYLSYYDYGTVNLYLQRRFQLKGQVNTINTACSSSANSIMYGARLIRSGRARRAIVGGVDSLAKFTINGFNALHILSHENCRPFDADRKGLNLGEGAAFLILEKESDAVKKKKYAALTGYSNANDAFHASSLSENGEGPYRVMKDAIALSGLQPTDINFINAHGTATENNDQVESVAMKRLFENVPLFASTKANIGHTLGAAGAIEAVYCVLNLDGQEVFPAISFREPIAETGLVPVGAYAKKPLEHIMSNSFGFAGNCSSLIFSKA